MLALVTILRQIAASSGQGQFKRLLSWFCCRAVITTGTNGPVISWRAPDRRAKRKGVPESADDAKPAAPGGGVAAQPPTAVMPVIPRDVEPRPEAAVRATSNSSRYRGVTRHRRGGGCNLNI